MRAVPRPLEGIDNPSNKGSAIRWAGRWFCDNLGSATLGRRNRRRWLDGYVFTQDNGFDLLILRTAWRHLESSRRNLGGEAVGL